MPDATAKLTFEESGGNALLAQIRALKAELGNNSSGTLGGAPGSSSGSASVVTSGGQIVATSGLPPAPASPATTLSHAAGNAGGMMPGAPSASAMANSQAVSAPSSPMPGPASFAPQATPIGGYGLGLSDLARAFGGQQAYSSLVGFGTQYGAGIANSAVSGRYFDARTMIPGAINAGFSTVGALAGFAVGGPAGAALSLASTAIGSVTQSVLQPLADHRAEVDRLGRLYAGTGLGDIQNASSQVASAADAALASGLPMTAPELLTMGGTKYFDFGTKKTVNVAPFFTSEASERGINAVNKLRYDPGTIRALGGLGQLDSGGGIMDVMRASAWSDPQSVIAAISAMNKESPYYAEGKDLLKTSLENIQTKAFLSGDLDMSTASVQLGQVQMSVARRYGSSAAVARSGNALGSEMGQVAGILKQMADKEDDPTKKMVLLAQAKSMEIEGRYIGPEAYFGARRDEIDAGSALTQGHAGRALSTALYGGVSASKLPWESVSAGFTQNADDLEALMKDRKASGMLSPAEEWRMREQIEQLRYEGGIGTDRRREQAVNSQAIASTELANTSRLNANSDRSMFGSASQQADSHQLELQNLKDMEATYRRILDTSKTLSAEERTRLQTSVVQLQVQEKQAEKALLLARAAAGEMVGGVRITEATTSSSIALIRGAGGAQASTAMGVEYASIGDRIQLKKDHIRDLLSRFSYDSPEVIEQREQLESMKVQQQQLLRSMAVVPMSGRDRATSSDLETMGAFYSAGYAGSQGAVRSNLLAQIGMKQKRLDEMAQHRASMMSTGKWSDAMEADYTESKNRTALESLGLQQSYDEGWDQRLISQAYAMPATTNGRLFMAGYTHREAAISGIFNRAFGGTESQTRRMRELPSRFRQMLTSGSPMGFEDQAMGAATNFKLTVDVNLRDNGAVLSKNSTIIDSQKTAAEVKVNANASTRPRA